MFPFTDDTAMTKSMAQSLIELKRFDAKDMAKRFSVEYFKDPKRGYGGNVVDVFAALRHTHYEYPYEPARLQFNGSGSYGNGGAMRTSPVALFGLHLSDTELIELATNCAKITHSNRNGYNGAILQCLAIREALQTQSSPTDHSFDVNVYLNSLIEKMQKVETTICTETDNNDSHNKSNGVPETPFTDKLNKIKKIFESETKVNELSGEKVAYILGNDVSALKSVPSAIYSVLRAQTPIETFQSTNPFVRTLYFALSLGGDTDTIASMACSIAGALYGNDLIPNPLRKHCEDIDLLIKYSEDLYDLVPNK
jgi:poly(ADP-ribose) glycohydrolase ARH3